MATRRLLISGLATFVLGVAVPAASAAPSATTDFTRGTGANDLVVKVTNSGTEIISDFKFELATSGFTISNVTSTYSAGSGGGQCAVGPSPDAITCNQFLNAGESITIDFSTDSQYPANGGGSLLLRDNGENPVGPFTVTGPPDTTTGGGGGGTTGGGGGTTGGGGGTTTTTSGVDLVASKNFQQLGASGTKPTHRLVWGQVIVVSLDVKNNGPDTATGVTLTDKTLKGKLLAERTNSGDVGVAVYYKGPGALGASELKPDEFSCDPLGAPDTTCKINRPIPAGGEVFMVIRSKVDSFGELSDQLTVSSDQTELTPADNTATWQATSYSPEAILEQLDKAVEQGKPGKAEGEARTVSAAAAPKDPLAAIAKVQVAIVKLGKSCSWLRSASGGFAAGKCTQQRWLPATGTTKWTFRLRRGLPKGRYVIYVRAVNKAGLGTLVFSGKQRNERAFGVS